MTYVALTLMTYLMHMFYISYVSHTWSYDEITFFVTCDKRVASAGAHPDAGEVSC